VRRQYSKTLRDQPAAAVLTLVRQLLASDETSLRLIAYELCAHHAAAMQRVRAPELRRLGVHLTSWFDTDCFGKFIAGPAWRAGQVSDAVIMTWARSKDYWWRRAALVSTIGQDTKRTLAVCVKLRDDHEPMVWKALSWALRELSKRDPSAVRQFIGEHERALARGVVREVRNKLATGTKAGRASPVARTAAGRPPRARATLRPRRGGSV
jgi:3-methyladenine DNA glycosylase AlkD